MIEIKEGWTAQDTVAQHDARELHYEIQKLNEKLALALERRAEIQLKCKHNHVSFAGQEMECAVCGLRIDK